MSSEEHKKEAEMVFLFIDGEGEITLVQTDLESLTPKQLKMVVKIICVTEPSLVLLVFLHIEIFFNYLIGKIENFWSKYR